MSPKFNAYPPHPNPRRRLSSFVHNGLFERLWYMSSSSGDSGAAASLSSEVSSFISVLSAQLASPQPSALAAPQVERTLWLAPADAARAAEALRKGARRREAALEAMLERALLVRAACEAALARVSTEEAASTEEGASSRMTLDVLVGAMPEEAIRLTLIRTDLFPSIGIIDMLWHTPIV